MSVRSHEELSSVPDAGRTFGWRRGTDAHPRILDFVRYESKDEGLSCSKISLAPAIRIFRFPFCPATWTVCSKNLRKSAKIERKSPLVKYMWTRYHTSSVAVLTIRMVGSCCSTLLKKVVILQPCSSVVYNNSGWYIVMRTGSQDHTVRSWCRPETKMFTKQN